MSKKFRHYDRDLLVLNEPCNTCVGKRLGTNSNRCSLCHFGVAKEEFCNSNNINLYMTKPIKLDQVG